MRGTYAVEVERGIARCFCLDVPCAIVMMADARPHRIAPHDDRVTAPQ